MIDPWFSWRLSEYVPWLCLFSYEMIVYLDVFGYFIKDGVKGNV